MEQHAVTNQRRHKRYETDARLEFRIQYDFKAEVDFKIDEEVMEGREHQYNGFSRDISVHGLSFETPKTLEPGELLWIDMHLPKSREVIFMQGEVCWCQPANPPPEGKPVFQVGVEIAKVNGVDVEQTIYFDKAYGVVWSELLEKVLGTFARINRKKS